jgi:hypothetical protein
MGHLAEDGQHRALHRLPDRLVGRVGRSRECCRDQHRIDQLAGPAGQLLRGTADDLAQDHAGVAARPHQRGAGERVDELGAADLVDHLSVEPVELVVHRPEGERHVVTGVAVGDREDVEVVDLLATLVKMGRGRSDDAPESLYRGIGHTGSCSGD